ncbi:unnamed protein product [Prunus armeniaca]
MMLEIPHDLSLVLRNSGWVLSLEIAEEVLAEAKQTKVEEVARACTPRQCRSTRYRMSSGTLY